MNALVKTVGFLGVCVLVFLLLQHGGRALRPARPLDMPAQAAFAQSGYDVSHLEAKGDWVACGTDTDEQTNWCRVTDGRGIVLYQGDFMPNNSDMPIPRQQIQIGNLDADRMWVDGPSEGGLVPVIPLTDGTLLVPAADRDALADRWATHPDEFATVRGANSPR